MSGDPGLKDEPILFYSEEMTVAKLIFLEYKVHLLQTDPSRRHVQKLLFYYYFLYLYISFIAKTFTTKIFYLQEIIQKLEMLVAKLLKKDKVYQKH